MLPDFALKAITSSGLCFLRVVVRQDRPQRGRRGVYWREAGKAKWKSWFATEGKLDLAVDQTSNSVLAIFVLDSAVDSRHGLRPVVLQ